MQEVRQFGKSVLEQVSNTRGLASGLKFLCSYSSSLSATFLGLRHALKLVKWWFFFGIYFFPFFLALGMYKYYINWMFDLVSWACFNCQQTFFSKHLTLNN